MATLTKRQLSARRRAGGGIAPNIIETVRKAMRDHPEIDTLNDDQRGRVLDYACIEANGPNRSTPWGRKSRGRPGEDMMPVNPNGDGMCFLRDDGDFEIYDAINGTNGEASWDFAGVFKQGENGYWARAIGSPDGPVVVEPTHAYVGGGTDTGICDQCGRARANAVHVVLVGKQPHTAFVGEDGKGDCDLCFKPVNDPIHTGVPVDPEEPEPVDPALVGRVVALEGAVVKLVGRVEAVEGNGGSLDPAALRDAVAVVLKGLTVTADVVPAGPKFSILGRAIDLNHDHGISIAIAFDGKEIARTIVAARVAPTVEPDAHDTSLNEAVRDSADVEGEA